MILRGFGVLNCLNVLCCNIVVGFIVTFPHPLYIQYTCIYNLSIYIIKFFKVHNKVIHGILLKFHFIFYAGIPQICLVLNPEFFLSVFLIKIVVKHTGTFGSAHIILPGIFVQINIIIVSIYVQVNEGHHAFYAHLLNV